MFNTPTPITSSGAYRHMHNIPNFIQAWLQRKKNVHKYAQTLLWQLEKGKQNCESCLHLVWQRAIAYLYVCLCVCVSQKLTDHSLPVRDPSVSYGTHSKGVKVPAWYSQTLIQTLIRANQKDKGGSETNWQLGRRAGAMHYRYS